MGDQPGRKRPAGRGADSSGQGSRRSSAKPSREGQSRGGKPDSRGSGRGAGDKSRPRRGETDKRGPRRPPRDSQQRDTRPPRRPERDERPERDTSNDLPWPEEIFDLELEPELLKELEDAGGRTETFAKHLLSVQVLAESDPEQAYLHAIRVRDRIARSALARQTACIAAYRTGRFKEAIKEEAAYRRIGGGLDLLPIAADSERGLGRPERALGLVAEFEKADLDSDTRTELLIVAGGARRDLGDDEAARVHLQKAVRAARSPMARARSRFALGELLVALGQTDEARKWLESTLEFDPEGDWTEAVGLLETLS
jgi:tetratricopeptide (TPR) repeat protein